jgi:predicted MPP superfamily phosphohydrolase
MWFVMLGVALVLLTVGALYLRRRLTDAARVLGAGPRSQRWLGRGVLWLLLGFPAIMFVTVAVALAVGAETMPRYDGPIATWLLVYPFFGAALVLAQSLPWLVVLELVHLGVRRWRGPAPAARTRALAAIAVLAAFAIYTPIKIVVERDALRVRHHALAAADGPRLRVVFLADLQLDRHTGDARVARVIRAVADADADLILSGGDWINTGPDHIAAAAEVAGALPSRLGTFTVRGDHEHFAYVDQSRSVREVEVALTARGVTSVTDQVRWFTEGGRRIGVAFLSHNYLRRVPPATVDALVAELAGADRSIVVTHQLDAALAARLRDRVDLILAGHTHGGQVNPVLGWRHVSLARVETPYVDGRYRLGTTTVIVTAGIGYSIVPFRYASPGSIEVIEL